MAVARITTNTVANTHQVVIVSPCAKVKKTGMRRAHTEQPVDHIYDSGKSTQELGDAPVDREGSKQTRHVSLSVCLWL